MAGETNKREAEPITPHVQRPAKEVKLRSHAVSLTLFLTANHNSQSHSGTARGRQQF